MLSSSTEKSVKKFFQSKDYFGLKKSQVTFFVQNNLAYLDEKLKPVKVEGKIVKAGDGNGGAIQVLQNSNWLKKLSRKKVEYLHVVPIDNALLDPLNLAMTGILSLKKWDALIAATKRGKKDKNFGALVQKEGKVTVIDYMELPKTYLEKPLEKVFPYINISHYCLKLSWLNSVLLEAELPIHWVKKKIPNRKNWVWKREMFFFDLFSYSDKIGAVYLPKDKYFYPLKEPADLSKVQKALQKRDRKLLGALGLQKLAKGPYELSSEFFYLTEELKEVISHRKLPSQGYVSLKTLEG